MGNWNYPEKFPVQVSGDKLKGGEEGQGSEILGAGYRTQTVDGCVVHRRLSFKVCLYLVFCFVSKA